MRVAHRFVLITLIQYLVIEICCIKKNYKNYGRTSHVYKVKEKHKKKLE